MDSRDIAANLKSTGRIGDQVRCRLPSHSRFFAENHWLDTALVGREPSPEIHLPCSVEEAMVSDSVVIQPYIHIWGGAVCK